MDYVKASIEHHCPEWADDEVKHAMAQRRAKLPSRFESDINEESLGNVEASSMSPSCAM